MQSVPAGPGSGSREAGGWCGPPASRFLLGPLRAQPSVQFSSVTQLCPTLRPRGLQHARLLCPSLAPGVCSNACPLSQLEKCEPPSFVPKGLVPPDCSLHAGTRWRQVCGRLHLLHCHHTPVYHGVPNDTAYFLSPAVIPSWIWGLFPQMVDSLKKIFKHSNLPQRRSLCETGFCKVCAAVVSSSQGNP